MKKVLIFIIGLLTVSCNSLLDTQPSDFLTQSYYFTTEEQLQFALNGVYDRLGASEVYGDRMTWTYNSSTDESFQKGRGTQGITVNNYDASHNDINNFWRVCYEGIGRANVLLANIDKPQMSDSSRNLIRGETLFLRAHYYFILALNFGGVPLMIEPTVSNENLQIPKASLQEVYTQIVADMTAAEALLQEQTVTSLGYAGRITKTAVQAMLARVNLHMAGYPLNDEARYQEALDWATKVVESGEHELNPDYAQVFINYAQDIYDVKESIYEIEFFGNGLDTYRETGRIGNNIGITCQDREIGQCYGSVNVSPKLFYLYDSVDTRRDWNCAPYVFSGTSNAVKVPNLDVWERNVGKWRREYETLTPKHPNNTPQNFAVIRYSDVLLMFAEAENHLNGPTNLAYDAVNRVRRRAYGKALDTPSEVADVPPGLSKEAFLAFIQDERARELCLEAIRRYDLIRWGIYLETMKDFADYIMAEAPENRQYYALAAQNLDERHLLFPIPQRELSVNPALTQNLGW
ncbi:RagB/SusD family nutrient uptake outer membrane protein [Parapedobacter tibetensis]|uniref:RagB/SusD family nutrient uptake outer membrane protein n=1 Tax=Parapedobacter tibetensis TaxID=2972951 RepID=UPI00214DC4AE|nr:RagB/SusD family nutrient uptake outer membrane protein [Parapedobacter tibetensis]